MIDPTDGCLDCGTLDRNHAEDCPLAEDQATPGDSLFSGCQDRLPGHLHCVHGHVADCPVPEDCPLVEDHPGRFHLARSMDTPGGAR